MPIDYKEIIDITSDVVKHKYVNVTVKQSAKGATVCGVCSFIGGLLLGPAGVAIGGIGGSMLAYGITKDSFRSLGDVIVNDLSEEQKRQLADRIQRALKDFHPADVVALLALIANRRDIKQTILKTVIDYVSKQMKNIQVID